MEISEVDEYFARDYAAEEGLDESLNEDACHAGLAGYRFFSVKRQLLGLGLFRANLDSLVENDAKVLDVGCGNGSLVSHLCEMGINAEGIGPTAPIGKRFMKQHISAVSPVRGCIPRKDKTYDLVVIHSIPKLNVAFSSFVDNNLDRIAGISGISPELARKEVDGAFLEAYILMCESLRVVKSGGELRVFPGLNRLEERMPLEIPGKYRVETSFSYFGLQLSLRALANGMLKDPEVHGFRTIVYRN